jgi:hypothetical protein
MPQTTATQTRSNRLLPAAARAAAIAVAANTALYVVARLAGAYPAGTVLTGAGASGAPSLLAIVGLSILASATALGLVAVLTRFVPRPGAVFLVIAASVLAGFAGGPLSLDAPLATTITLEVMHLVVAVPIVVESMRALEARPRRRYHGVRAPSEAAV